LNLGEEEDEDERRGRGRRKTRRRQRLERAGDKILLFVYIHNVNYKVIGAGFGRTGTMSLKLALEELGFGPCYHMVEVDKNEGHVVEWTSAADGASVDWDDIFKNYHSGVDWPVARYWHELSIVYPKAKVILSVRDPERWYSSCYETIFTFGLNGSEFPMSLLPTLLPSFGKFLHMVSETVYIHHFGGDLANKEKAISVFNRHNEEGSSANNDESIVDDNNR